ncbi:hypothetical protein [Paenibacillus hexagrammi]|uniref:Uncharacterized protein n=1 Tax=Paenibacillus hexagrammi TaxID=2908839 RepID=A0ABY3SLQ7_9BACL|nr:hypothetical protein [Paenibacillus sp. YPD9-1]UJF34818.1 hypothetical protein L0M14_06585 [Paenibacillus sp. YPD9-1]
MDPYLVKESYQRPILDIRSEKRLRELKANIDMFVESSRRMFIQGQFRFDDWNKYEQTLNDLGLREMEALYQKAYDTLKKAADKTD